MRLKPEGGFEEIYRTANMASHINTCVLYQDHLYGFSTDRLCCIEYATGKRIWEQRGLGRGSQVLVDGHLAVLTEKGEVLLLEATPAGYKEKGRAKVLQGDCWAMPAFAYGHCYVRNERALAAVDMRA